MFPLNPLQRQAVRYLDGPLLVVAGAGSGKTRVITEKMAYLIDACGHHPANVAAITFTNKAAREMRERVARLLAGRATADVVISTFHALGVRILREEARWLEYKPQFSILDASDCLAILSELAGSVDKAGLRSIQNFISNWKNGLILPPQARAVAGSPREKLAADLYASYSATLRAYQAVDFDDLIALPVVLLTEHPEICDKWQNRLRYLLIDEYQDTNASQYRLLRLLVGVRAAFTAVGDNDQAIYGWRGADSENLRRLACDYPRLQVIKLEQNYRSTIRILRSANALIEHNEKRHEKKLWSELGLGDLVTVSVSSDSEKEAEAVVMRLQAHRFEHHANLRDYAILYRGNFQARVVEQFLRRQRLPYRLSGGQSFFERSEIKDLTAYLRLLANTSDDQAFIRSVTTPRRGVGASTLQALGHYAGERHLPLFAAAQEEGFAHRVQVRQRAPLLAFCDFVDHMRARAEHDPAAQVLHDLLRDIDYETWLSEQEEASVARTRMNNVREFFDWLGRKGEEEEKTLLDLTQTLALIAILDQDDDDADRVHLSTLHAAKGLEFKHVFLIGVEEGILPHREALTEQRLEEERRLMYVGITRAQHSLHLSYAEMRKQGRTLIRCEPSRFIAEMDRGDLRYTGRGKDVAVDRTTASHRLTALRAMLKKDA